MCHSCLPHVSILPSGTAVSCLVQLCILHDPSFLPDCTFFPCLLRWRKSSPGTRLAGPAANRVQNASDWNIRPGLKYEWKASKECGNWQDFEPDRFCLQLRKLGFPLLIVGDSLSKSMMQSLLNQLQMLEESNNSSTRLEEFFTPQICKKWEKTTELDHGRGACIGISKCKVPIVHARNDRLTLVEHLPIVDVKILQPGKKRIEVWRNIIDGSYWRTQKDSPHGHLLQSLCYGKYNRVL